MELVEQLKQDGIAKGLCQPWQMKLKPGVSTQRLVKLFIRGIDFCVNKNYPTLEFMRENFKGNSEPYGAYVDDVVNEKNLPDVVLNGDCKGTLVYDSYTVSRVVVRHTSKVSIKVFGYAHLTVDVFDDSALDLVVAGTRARVLVNKYGNSNVIVSGSGVKVVFKNKNTY
ncbi:MAG: hypothetical protein IJ379_13405 [Lachnospiraceae bacterium]|nr:hypothetical protein [Lachnospiraceae bacterium]